jgi:hypothetical protein
MQSTTRLNLYSLSLPETEKRTIPLVFPLSTRAIVLYLLKSLVLLHLYREIHAGVNRAIDVVGASGREGANADAGATQLQILQSGRASGCRRLGRRTAPLTKIQNMERGLVLNNFQRAALAQRDAGLLKSSGACLHRVTSSAGRCRRGRGVARVASGACARACAGYQ